MYRYCTLFLSFLFCLTQYNSQAQVKFGVGGGYISDASAVLLQTRLEIGPESFKMTGAFNFILEDGSDWAIDIDGHYKILDISDEIYIDAFPGINLLKNNNDTDIGINLGAALRIQTNANVIFFEPKYTVGTYDSFAVTGGFIF